ncbi:MAG: Gfo/Idh/MocA family oxidoreductase [Lachnospiraceae bacterium]|nr:Gfo/Idh/MocA family oxidoreductase [Lachnospiraceae bacterium]
MQQEFGWCFIGCGTLADVVAKQIVPTGRHKIVSCYTRRYEAGKDFASHYGAKAYETAKEAICAEGVDGVYIVTPHRSHYEYAMLALKCGKPVLCEKSFTVNAAQAEEVLSLAEEKKIYIAEAMWTWFSPIGNQVRKWVQDGEFGTVKNCLVDCRTNAQHYAKRVTDPAAAGGAVLDMGVYATYYLYKLFGKPDEVVCLGTVKDGIDWSEEITFTYKDGRNYKALVSINDEGVTTNMKLEGDKASIFVNELHYANHAEFTDASGQKKEITADGSYVNEFDRVAEEIREGRTESRFVTHTDTRTIMHILDDCRQQMGLEYEFERE